MKLILWIVCCSMAASTAIAQHQREAIYAEFVLYNKRKRLEKDLRDNIVGRTFLQEINEDNEHRFEAACNAITQFQFTGDTVQAGFQKMLEAYPRLHNDTRRALLEALYAVYPSEYQSKVHAILLSESDPRLFAMASVYLYRNDNSIENTNQIKISMVEQFPDYDSSDLLLELERYIDLEAQTRKKPIPALKDLIQYQQRLGNKVIWSFQRWNRDYPGMAAVQNADGSFIKRSDGRIMLFEQLARSGSSLPFFLTNGNTPQGLYRIQGTGISRNNFIGPTPNIQLLMPFEDSLSKFFLNAWDSSAQPLTQYSDLLPPSWRSYRPLRESFYAGKIGRSAIIAHGSTIDPEYFRGKNYYPLTPTQGCLCTKELWNVTNGRLLVSEQFNLFSAFMATPGHSGLLIVVNLNDEPGPVTREELERLIPVR